MVQEAEDQKEQQTQQQTQQQTKQTQKEQQAQRGPRENDGHHHRPQPRSLARRGWECCAALAHSARQL